MRSIAGTELSRETYISYLTADYARLLACLPNESVAVPSCPGWSTNDLAKHMGHVYLGQAFVVETGVKAEAKEHLAPYARTDDVREFMGWGFTAIVKALDLARPERKTWSWHHSDNTVDFWFRRMAHETVIHRIDAELACGSVTTIPEDLALDGIDEVLDFLPLLGSWEGAPNQAFGIVSICALGSKQDTHWDIEFTADYAAVTKAESVSPLARLKISGTPEAMDLYLWGRISSSDSRITITGDGEADFKQLMQVAVL
jgi:uncharacterized protein (TIGR03083 family)